MKLGAAAPLFAQFNTNWAARKPALALALTGDEIPGFSGHPLEAEIKALCDGKPATLPFFKGDEVAWCTMAPAADDLRQAVLQLQAWILPSFGWEQPPGGLVSPQTAVGPLSQEILRVSPTGYFRWRCRTADFQAVVARLALRQRLESSRPPKTRPYRPSLFELRSRFSTALLLGGRDDAEQAVADIAQNQLDSAANILFMRIRMWHRFREFDRIVNHPDLPRLRTQPLPATVLLWIQEAVAASAPPTGPAPPAEPARPITVPAVAPALPTPQPAPEPRRAATWREWFEDLLSGRDNSAEAFLLDRAPQTPDDLAPDDIRSFVGSLESIFLNESLSRTHRDMLVQGLAEFLQDFVREPEFPRAAFSELYLAVLRVWSLLHAGSSAGPEGHVLLELAGACLRLNCEPGEVLQLVQQWWAARKVPAQLPFALDAIELLEQEHPDQQASASLWIDAAELVRRTPEALSPSDQTLWRRVGAKLGFDHALIQSYLPIPEAEVAEDPVKAASLQKVAIVCMRDRQASEAATIISQRTGAEVVVVQAKAAGQETTRALSADVVLFVWMATTHAVFRAFDGFDRKRFCYVQGTGAASIVRSLERWASALT